MGGRGKDTIKSFPCSSEAREKIAREKNNGSVAGGPARLWRGRRAEVASPAWRGELTH